MVLLSLLGLGAQLLFHVEVGFAVGLIAGLVVAQFVPTDKACGIPGKPPPETGSADRP